MAKLTVEKQSNVFIEAEGESRQRLDLRFDPKTIARAHAVTDEEKIRAQLEGLPEPKLTWIVERALQLGLAVLEEANRERKRKDQLLQEAEAKAKLETDLLAKRSKKN